MRNQPCQELQPMARGASTQTLCDRKLNTNFYHMGRHRKIFSEHDLPPRVYMHHGAFRYVPRDGSPVSLGRDYGEAMRKWATIVKPATELGTVSALIDWYLVNVAP